MSFNTFIINPASGAGSTKKLLKTLVKEIHARDSSAKIVLTRHALHAIGLTKEAIKSGARRIIVIGGDGTLNEVVNGFFDKEGKPVNDKTTLAIVPSGTGSDFIRSIEHRSNLKDAVEFAIDGTAKFTDVGVVEAQDANGLKVKRCYINISSVGLSGLVAGFMKTVTRRFGSRTAYFLATLQAIRAFKPATLLITSDDMHMTLENCSLVSLANGRYFGSGMKIAPDAELDDGKLDLITIQDLGALFFIQHGIRVYQGTHTSLPNIHAHQGRNVMVQSLTKDSVYVEVDGELFAELPARYSVMQQALPIVR